MNLDDFDLMNATTPPTNNGGSSRRAKGPVDPVVAKRNKRNRKRGNRTSADLAKYLGGWNVEGAQLPWDVETKGARIQSKREAANMTANRALGLLQYIDASQALRVLFHVAPRQRLASGTVYCLYREWVGWYGWTTPPHSWLVATKGEPLIAMPLPTFRDIHVGG